MALDDAVMIDSDPTVHLEKRPVPLRQARKRFDPAPDAAVQSDCCFRRVQIQGDITDNIFELLCGVVCDLDSVDFHKPRRASSSAKTSSAGRARPDSQS